MKLTLFAILTVLPITANARHLKKEAYYQNYDCRKQHGKMEVVLTDRTRADCVTDSEVIEYDFGQKWYEAIGQSLHYARLSGKKAAIGLIIERPSDEKYFKRAESEISYYHLPIHLIKIVAVQKDNCSNTLPAEKVGSK